MFHLAAGYDRNCKRALCTYYCYHRLPSPAISPTPTTATNPTSPAEPIDKGTPVGPKSQPTDKNLPPDPCHSWDKWTFCNYGESLIESYARGDGIIFPRRRKMCAHPCYVGRRGDVYAWADESDMGDLRDLTLAVLDIATVDLNSLVSKMATHGGKQPSKDRALVKWGIAYGTSAALAHRSETEISRAAHDIDAAVEDLMDAEVELCLPCLVACRAFFRTYWPHHQRRPHRRNVCIRLHSARTGHEHALRQATVFHQPVRFLDRLGLKSRPELEERRQFEPDRRPASFSAS